ncbi:MASE1 domain-containing protein [soil metagenome]
MIKTEKHRRDAYMALVLCLCYVANLWLTNALRQQAGGIDTIWTANAFVIGALLLLPARWTLPTLASGFIIQVGVVLMFKVGLVDTLGFGLLNTLEALGVAWAARRIRVVRLTTPSRFAGLIFLALLPILVAGSLLLGLGALALHGEFPITMLSNRLPAKFLGMGLVLPAILLLGRGGRAGLMPTPLWERLAAYLLMAGLAALMFSPVSAVALFVAFPAITLLGLRMGPRAVTLAMALICMVVLPLGIQHAPAGLMTDHQDLNRQITLSQVYLAMLFATGLIVALMATHQQRLRQILARRSASYMRARDRAQAASVAKTEFLAAMSHEVRTPLNSIIGFAEVLERRADLPAESRHQIGLIGRSGGALLTVVNDILDFSKVEAGRIDLDPKPVDLVQACEDALSIVADGAERKGLALALTCEGELGAAHVCDDHRLGQVLLNLLNNAVKFTDAGGVTLALAVEDQGELDLVRIAVTDTGPGISAEAAARLFQRFSQVDSSVSRTHGGTGLGLAICKGLVELMGGKVGVRSTPGQGSTFWLEIPMTRALAIAAAPADQARAQGLAAHILLVDDHPMNRELGVTILTLLGCTADVACDGREAIEAVQTRRYDAIMMDVHMPIVDGLAATRAIRALGGPVSLTPIIAMSADVLPEQVAKMREAGMVDSVGKPVSIQALHDCLARWVGRDAAGEVLAA